MDCRVEAARVEVRSNVAYATNVPRPGPWSLAGRERELSMFWCQKRRGNWGYQQRGPVEHITSGIQHQGGTTEGWWRVIRAG